jgi:hypothetical protein
MCAKRADLIDIGGADEHMDYLGHICGPYEMTFRLVNHGLREIWHDSEFLCHTWHPGQAGIDNYQGPHDGKHMSSTALEALVFRRVLPLVENKAIKLLRTGADLSDELIATYLVDERYLRDWDRIEIQKRNFQEYRHREDHPAQLYRGFKITQEGGEYCARRLIRANPDPALRSTSLPDLKAQIDDRHPHLLRLCELVNSLYWLFEIAFWSLSVGIVRTGRLLFNRGASPLLSRLFESHKTYRAGWLAMRQYGAYMRDWVSHLTANLYFLSNQTRSGNDGDRPILLITSRYVEFYLKFLRTIRILPSIRIIR